DALVGAARKRDRTLRISRAAVVRFHGRPALQVVGTETVGTQPRMVRSTHIFTDHSEVVVEALAPPDAFAGLQRSVFAPLLRSLKISPIPRCAPGGRSWSCSTRAAWARCPTPPPTGTRAR